ncbi:DMT family transporter [Halalkalibacter alkalisediminis]|uniref:DMT family transporter n=1 Tax=Halalkalibacter alkalisediminis TaxID=935616 RepID=UPI00363F89DE
MNKIIFSLLVILTTALMGSSFAIGKLGLAYSSPLLLVALRFTFAGIIMAVIVKVFKREHPKQRGEWFKITLIGLAQTAGVMGCIFVALRTINAGETSILTFINPLLVVVLATLFLKIKYGFRQWLGVSIGFIGVFITLGAHLDFKVGTILGFLSAVSWAIGTLLIKKWGDLFDTWVLTAYQMLLGGLILLVASFILETPYFILSLNSIIILGWLAIMASIVQFAVWFYLLTVCQSNCDTSSQNASYEVFQPRHFLGR